MNKPWRDDTKKWFDSLEHKPIVIDNLQANPNLIRVTPCKRDFIYRTLKSITVNGLYTEFGVFEGSTLRIIASRIHPKTIHGFDSFEGLPEEFEDKPHKLKKGHFKLEKKGWPHFEEENIKIHIGMFDESIPKFLEETNEPITFMHIDCDVYSSTKTILSLLAERIIPGTIIMFDELWNYSSWRVNEWKAFMESCEEFGWEFKILYCILTGYQASLVITKTEVT